MNRGSNTMLFNFKLFSKVYYALLLLFLNIVGGAVGFVIIEGYDWIDAFYQTIITISTVGFGEVHQFTPTGKLFVSVLIITSFGTFAYAVTSITSYIVSGDYRQYFKDYRTMKEITELQDHVIVCGYGRVGKQAVATLVAHHKNFVVIEQKEEIIEGFREKPEFLYLQGNATSDDTLIAAGIKNAKAIITTLPSDSENLFVVLTARELNKQLTIISRASAFSSIRKLKIAGANNVIMPDSLGGSHMAQLVTNPDVLEFIDQISIQGENVINLEEIDFKELPEDRKYKSLADLREQFPFCNIIGFKNKEGEYIINPGLSTEIVPGSKLFVLGNPEQIKNLNKQLRITKS
ncbi:potassium channel family protein [Parvicella tangerina]|uniref:Glutathione-regulated potassium-efflux system protein KefC n=1 Tax=Parvicella tangerina TaxID=2829795 RepID=A0A916NQ22_9FLAO|nr:potassium channel protein [Parvicella tangerina]CAG5078123.1 Glutathione-regulated potassium-efflux system protein KefC [Parvicella tangerina]